MATTSTNLSAQLAQTLRGPSLTIWLCAASVWIFIIWASYAWVDEIVRGEGEVISSSRPQIIQNLEGGILAELLVSEGDEVQPGQVLARLRGTQFQTSVDDLQEQIYSGEVRRLRLEAEIAGQMDFEVPVAIAQTHPDIVASELALLVARQADYRSKVEGARGVLEQTQRELASMEDMYRREIVALFEVTRARKANQDAESKLNEIITGTELDRAAAYSDTLQKLGKLKQDLRFALDQLGRTTITSPMHGIVNNLGVTTIGGVIRPGEEIFQIIPMDDQLFIEAQVKPEDIAPVQPGQTATIKLSAYDYTIYGSQSGQVQFISADTFKDERRPEIAPHYKVTLSVDLANLTDRQRSMAIRPGMQAVVEMNTGQKTVLQYLTKPLYRGREAMREP
ncbi:MAG: HlyD family efflux transporter periplasmic adaptor subunit [Rhodobacteraceae bacterium]|nr:HlyD family efflux transporter periplasmic adaptor subunit [Paracoccaceae bacterium]